MKPILSTPGIGMYRSQYRRVWNKNLPRRYILFFVWSSPCVLPKQGGNNTKLIYSRIDFEILNKVKDHPALNRDLVKLGITMSTEGYVYQRLRNLSAKGYITRTGRDRLVTITGAGLDALAMMSDAEAIT